ncbi:calmodulin-like protein 1 [Pistacia vera]|uniref:calmodulin-like protein 1 n=1 Tax=Pistacia vera TaxID=55513 RepID=UPI0012632C3A|nr:calmodulin-like protein 1 [Pistacia vera]
MTSNLLSPDAIKIINACMPSLWFCNSEDLVHLIVLLTQIFVVAKTQVDMANVSFLDFHYKISKNKFLRKPSRLFSRDRQNSGLLPTFMPNRNEMKKVFDKIDSNKDGKISQSEYKAILRALGQGNITAEVPKIFQAVDQDGDGYIDFKEFTEIHKKGGGVRTMDIQSAFRAFDMNHDGKALTRKLLSNAPKVKLCTPPLVNS